MMLQRSAGPAAFALIGALVATLALHAFGAAQAAPLAAGSSTLVNATVLPVSCTSAATFTASPAVKITDIGTFTTSSIDSVVEVVFNGRLMVSSFTSGTGAVFEVRVDDTATTNGRARASLRAAEAGGGGIQASITGIFTGLSQGTHTVSVWVNGAHGGGTGAYVDPGCWSTDHVVVKEYRSFGAAFLPTVAH